MGILYEMPKGEEAVEGEVVASIGFMLGFVVELVTGAQEA